MRKIFTEAITHPSIVALSIATRPDCLGEDVLQLLWELNQIKPVWVELGLQTIHERTAAFIRRGYPLSVFEQAVKQLTQIDVQVIVHTILGLPFESKNDMIDTIQYLAQFSASRQQEKKEKAVIQGIKLQLLHVLAGTDLAKYRSYFKTLTLEQYVNLVLECIEQLPQDIVIHRTTGDGPKKILLAPEWSASKKTVMNTIHREMKLQDSWQGKKVVIK